MSIDDDASQHEAIFLEAALSYRKPTIEPVGICHNCDLMIPKGNFCSPECRDDYVKRENFNRGMR